MILDKSWEKAFKVNSINSSDAASQEGGARQFQKRAIEEINKISRAGFAVNAVERIIKIIKELKA